MKRILVVLTLIMTLLNTTFCSNEARKEGNPLLADWDTPHGVPPFDEIKPEHYKPAFEKAMELHNGEIQVIIANTEEPTFENTILELDRSGVMLTNLYEIFGMMCAAMNDAEMQKLQEEMMPKLAAHYDAISMNEELFKRIKSVYDKREAANLNEDQLRLVEKMYKSAARQGALLDQEKKSRLMAINEEL